MPSLKEMFVASDYVRLGACNRCGKCCTALALWESMSETDKAIVRAYDPNAETLFKSAAHGTCPNLAKSPDGTFYCKIYDHRPRFCKLYPYVPGDLISGCSFKIVRKNKSFRRRKS
jgi:Fe-S-cluster containining protein